MSEHDPGGLELDGREIDAALRQASARLGRFVDGLDDAPASAPPPETAVLAALGSPPPEAPGELGPLLDRLLAAASSGFDTAGPGYLAYIPGGGLPSSAIGDLVADVTNRFTGLVDAAPGLAAIEQSVITWLCGQFGLPAGAGGDLTSGGSLSILSAVVTARHDRLGDDLSGATLYTSEQAHHAVARAARIAGLGPDAVRPVATTDDLALDPMALDARIDTDRRDGRRPFLVVGTAGTTNTGAIDPLRDIRAVATARDLWFHVDGAYGGAFQLTERGRDRLAGIEEADSITIDPHKGLFLPYGTGVLLVRDLERLAAAFRSRGSYMRDLGADGLVSFTDVGPELTRPARGLRLWLPLHLHGVAAFRAALDEKLDLAVRAHRALAAVDAIEVPWAPPLSIVAFRHRGGDDATLRVAADVNRTGRILLSTTEIGGRVHARLAILSFRTHVDRIDEAVELVRRAS